MTSVPPAAVYQQKVDVLRGWAALSVLIMHSYRQKLLPEFPLAHYASYLQADRAAVLLFFVISGYVIGLSNKQAWSPTGARGYAWRRLLRLGPVYMLAILLAWVAIPAENWRTVLGHLAFLQDSNADNPLRVDLLAANTPLWSLHYEALFYLLFLVWWRWPASVGPSLLLSVAAGIWATAATRAPGYVISHSVGSIFWLSGLLLSRCPPAAIANIPGKIIGGLLWLLAAYHFAPVPLLRAGLHLPAAAKTYMPLDDLIYLPLTVTLVAYAGGRRLPGGRLWHLVAFGTAAAGLLMILVAQKNLLDVRWLVSIAYLTCGLVVYFQPVRSDLAILGWIGSYSYALYALHYPILLMLGRIFPPQVSFPAGLGITALGWLIVFPLAWWIELRVQPRLRARLNVR